MGSSFNVVPFLLELGIGEPVEGSLVEDGVEEGEDLGGKYSDRITDKPLK